MRLTDVRGSDFIHQRKISDNRLGHFCKIHMETI